MKLSECGVLILGLLVTGGASAQTDTPVTAEAQREQQEELRAMEERRARLLEELQQLRDELEASDARMAESRERVRELESQNTPPAQGKP